MNPERNKLYAFISYQNNDKERAGQLKDVLSSMGVSSFLAHEDIEVSYEWGQKILEELEKANLFFCLLSENYCKSFWCIQESGIAAFKKNVTIIPFSLDGTIPQGFIAKYQAAKVGDRMTKTDIIPGLLKHDFDAGIQAIIETIRSSGSFRGAEANFELILPHIGKMKEDQIRMLLKACVNNSQIHHAGKCASEYIPPLLKDHGHLLIEDDRQFLVEICEQYQGER